MIFNKNMYITVQNITVKPNAGVSIGVALQEAGFLAKEKNTDVLLMYKGKQYEVKYSKENTSSEEEEHVWEMVDRRAPVMIAWEKYRNTEEYEYGKKWALKEEHTDGSLWNAFLSGYEAGRGEK